MTMTLGLGPTSPLSPTMKLMRPSRRDSRFASAVSTARISVRTDAATARQAGMLPGPQSDPLNVALRRSRKPEEALHDRAANGLACRRRPVEVVEIHTRSDHLS